MFGFALSGLQEFLYDVSDDQIHRRRSDLNAAKRLRIRSAILTLTPALVAHEILKFDNTAQPVFLGGGKLLMFASNYAARAIEPKLWELYDWLVQASDGKLGAYWAATSEEAPSSEGIKKLINALACAKWRAGKPGDWVGSSGRVHDRLPETLGNADWEGSQGGDFVRRVNLAGFSVGVEGWQLGPWTVCPSTQTYCDIGLQSSAHAPIRVSIPLHVPKDVDGSVAELFKLAEEGMGASYLALLKLDGDGIGGRMSDALNADADFGAYRATSAEMSAFFGEFLLNFLEEKFPRIYLVYSGGDDLVATGHFSLILQAAAAIRREYRAQNLGTISAGVSFYTRNSPILKAVEAADYELASAKTVKNAICIAGCRTTWDELDRTIQETEALVEAIDSQHINRGVLQLLRQLGDPWLAGALPEVANLKWRSMPMLHYMRSRREWPEDQWGTELRAFFNQLSSPELSYEEVWSRAALVGTLAGWKTKKGEDTK